MDALSSELQDFLIRLGRNPDTVSHKVEHYMRHILQLLQHDEEEILRQYYGLFGSGVKTLDDIAYERGVSAERMQTIITASLRRLAVTPEWQMVKQLV